MHRHGGGELLQPELAAMYDAFETPRAVRGDLPLLDRAQALAYLAEVRERTLRGAGASAAPATAQLLELVLRHEQQHGETMLQAIEHARLLPAPALRPDPRPARARRPQRPGVRRGARRPVHARRRPVRLRLRQRAPAPPRRAPRLPDRPHAGHQRHLADASPRAAATSAASGGATRAGPGRRTTTSPTRAAGPAARPDGGSGGSTAGRRCTPTSPSSTCPGSRPMPSPAHTARASRRRPSGRRQRPGTRRRDGPAGTRGATSRPARAAPTSARRASARTRPARTPRARRRAARSGCSATSGSGPRATFRGYDGFVAHPYREYSEVFFGRDYRVLRGGSWASRERATTRHDAQLGPPRAPPDLLRACAWRGTHERRRRRPPDQLPGAPARRARPHRRRRAGRQGPPRARQRARAHLRRDRVDTEQGRRFVDAPEVARITLRRVTLTIDAAEAAELPRSGARSAR